MNAEKNFLEGEVSDPYRTSVDLDVINSPKLSARSKGLYGIICYLRQKGGVKNPTASDLRRYTPDGATAIAVSLRELRCEGFLPAPVRPNPLAGKPGFVYLLGLEGKTLYKIGASKNYPNRISQIAKQCPYPASLVQVVPTKDMGKTEMYLHSHFSQQRKHGEWFELSLADTKDFLRLAGRPINS